MLYLLLPPLIKRIVTKSVSGLKKCFLATSNDKCFLREVIYCRCFNSGYFVVCITLQILMNVQMVWIDVDKDVSIRLAHFTVIVTPVTG